ncbi:hypothetical protein H4S07_002841 [Coemansia furcata]|uniref:Uncharacterized protein n=1 Tax=Coemansia furcata TaxID=417177 RepID=A0ACC1LIY8_9FUNG|nr:hypothetical protein H4S07_002841 [Coemansia furcata]
MAVLSVFQTLPMLIAEKVVEYVDRRNRNVFDSDIALDIDDWSDIGSGKFGIASFQSESELPVFPSASTLMVCLDENDANPAKARYGTLPASNSVPVDRNQETINFVSSIRRLTPASTGVVVFFRSPSSTNKKNRGQCNTLVLELCRGDDYSLARGIFDRVFFANA